MSRLEPVLVAFFIATWVVDLLAVLGLVDLRGNLELGLYPLYSTAAAVGWVSGNLYIARGQGLPRALQRRVLLVYYLGPPGLLYLLRAMASLDAQRAAPLAALYSFGVFSVLFLVPVFLPRAPARRSFRGGGRAEDGGGRAADGGGRAADGGGRAADGGGRADDVGRRDGDDRDGNPPVVP